MSICILAFWGGAPGGGEILLVLVVLLLLFGAKKLPGMARNLGHMLEEFRRAARDVSDELMQADAPPPPTYPDPQLTEDNPPGEKEKDDGSVERKSGK
jgi:sec-independent protein translocase protein TatA